MQNKKTGFTLIELLVVVAIIAILSSVVIVNLNSARDRGQDAAIKQQVAQIRSAAVLYESDNNNFANITGNLTVSEATCGDDRTMFKSPGVAKARAGLAANAGSSTNILCGIGSNGTTWVIYVKLQSVANTYWCADSEGITGATPPSTAKPTSQGCPQ